MSWPTLKTRLWSTAHSVHFEHHREAVPEPRCSRTKGSVPCGLKSGGSNLEEPNMDSLMKGTEQSFRNVEHSNLKMYFCLKSEFNIDLFFPEACAWFSQVFNGRQHSHCIYFLPQRMILRNCFYKTPCKSNQIPTIHKSHFTVTYSYKVVLYKFTIGVGKIWWRRLGITK